MFRALSGRISGKYVLLAADSDNGRAKFCKSIGVTRNAVYWLILDWDGTVITRVPSKSIVRTMQDSLERRGKPVVDHLIALLGDKSAWTRADAAEALGKLGAKAKKAVPLLINALADPEGAVAYQAIHTLGEIGPASVSALSAMAKLYADKKRPGNQRQMVLMVTGKIDPKGAATLPLLRLGLRDDYLMVIGAAIGVKAMGPHAVALKPDLLAARKRSHATAKPYVDAALKAIAKAAK